MKGNQMNPVLSVRENIELQKKMEKGIMAYIHSNIPKEYLLKKELWDHIGDLQSVVGVYRKKFGGLMKEPVASLLLDLELGHIRGFEIEIRDEGSRDSLNSLQKKMENKYGVIGSIS